MIIYRLGHRELTAEVHREGQSQTQNVRNSVARMLIINGVAFFACLSVYQFYNVHQFLKYNSYAELIEPEHESTMTWIGRVLSVLNSAINPLIYSMCNGRYRNAFLKTLRCCSKNNPLESSKRISRQIETPM